MKVHIKLRYISYTSYYSIWNVEFYLKYYSTFLYLSAFLRQMSQILIGCLGLSKINNLYLYLHNICTFLVNDIRDFYGNNKEEWFQNKYQIYKHHLYIYKNIHQPLNIIFSYNYLNPQCGILFLIEHCVVTKSINCSSLLGF